MLLNIWSKLSCFKKSVTILDIAGNKGISFVKSDRSISYILVKTKTKTKAKSLNDINMQSPFEVPCLTHYITRAKTPAKIP